MAETTVDVVIPTIGRTSLMRALESVREQTEPPLNVFVVLDDLSRADAVREMLREPSEKLLMTAGSRRGAVARNIGLSASVATYVAYLDDDDWWESRKLAVQRERMDETQADVSFTHVYFHGYNGNVSVLPKTRLVGTTSVASYMVQRPGLRYGAGFIQSSTLMVRVATTRGVAWDTRLPKHQDWDYVARLACVGSGNVNPLEVEMPLSHVTQGTPGSVSKSSNWRASAVWLKRHGGQLDRRAFGDFVLCHVVRGALSQMDGHGVVYGFGQLRGTKPHAAAWLVALSGGFGALERLIARKRRRVG